MIFLKELFEKNNNLELLIIIMYHLSQDTNMYFNNQNIKPGKLNTDNLQELHEILINRINEYIENKENLCKWKTGGKTFFEVSGKEGWNKSNWTSLDESGKRGLFFGAACRNLVRTDKTEIKRTTNHK